YGAIVSGSAGEEFRFALRNSMAVAALSTGVSLITAVLAAYAFSSFGTPRRLNVLYALLATYMMPPVAIALPLYQMLAALSLLNTSTSQAKTLPVAIAEFTTRHAVDFGLMSAGGIVAALPPVLLAFALQRYLIAGLTAGAVKA